MATRVAPRSLPHTAPGCGFPACRRNRYVPMSVSKRSSDPVDESELQGLLGGPDSGWPAGERGVELFANEGIFVSSKPGDSLTRAALLPGAIVGTISLYATAVALTGEINQLTLLSTLVSSSSSAASRLPSIPPLAYKLAAAAGGIVILSAAYRRAVVVARNVFASAVSVASRTLALAMFVCVVFARIIGKL